MRMNDFIEGDDSGDGVFYNGNLEPTPNSKWALESHAEEVPADARDEKGRLKEEICCANIIVMLRTLVVEHGFSDNKILDLIDQTTPLKFQPAMPESVMKDFVMYLVKEKLMGGDKDKK